MIADVPKEDQHTQKVRNERLTIFLSNDRRQRAHFRGIFSSSGKQTNNRYISNENEQEETKINEEPIVFVWRKTAWGGGRALGCDVYECDDKETDDVK